MIRPPHLLAAALALTVFAPSLSAQAEEPGPREQPLREGRLEGWIARTARIEEQLRDGDCRQARNRLDGLLAEMTAALTGGPGVGAILATPLRLRSLASACLDEPRLALWDYHVAEALAPGSTATLLTSSGDHGTKLATFLREEEESLARVRLRRGLLQLTPPTLGDRQRESDAFRRPPRRTRTDDELAGAPRFRGAERLMEPLRGATSRPTPRMIESRQLSTESGQLQFR